MPGIETLLRRKYPCVLEWFRVWSNAARQSTDRTDCHTTETQDFEEQVCLREFLVQKN